MTIGDYKKLTYELELTNIDICLEAESVVDFMNIYSKDLLKKTYLGTLIGRLQKLLKRKKQIYKDIHNCIIGEADAASFKEAPNG